MSDKLTINQVLGPENKKREIYNFRDFIHKLRETYFLVQGANYCKFVHKNELQKDKKEALKLPAIAYKMAHKRRARLANGTEEIKPRYRTTIKDPLNDKQSSTIYGQRCSYTLELCFYDDDWEKVDAIAEGFEDFLFIYAGFFKNIGVSEIIFEEAQDEDPQSSWRVDLVSRCVIFTIIIDRTFSMQNQAIENINILLQEEKE